MSTFPDIPDFLRITEPGPSPLWKGRKLTRQGSGFRTIDAAEERSRNRLLREYEREKARKQRERLDALKDRDRD